MPVTFPDITFTSDGTLYGVLYNINVTNSIDLWSVNVNTRAITRVSASGFVPTLGPGVMAGGGIAADANNTLYFSGEYTTGPLRTIDRISGHFSAPIATMNPGVQFQAVTALAFNAAGTLYGATLVGGHASRASSRSTKPLRTSPTWGARWMGLTRSRSTTPSLQPFSWSRRSCPAAGHRRLATPPPRSRPSSTREARPRSRCASGCKPKSLPAWRDTRRNERGSADPIAARRLGRCLRWQCSRTAIAFRWA